ncbi:MAG TPA: RimK family protein [Longimicrobiales bacterium]|nr:RimK family protein [Longimicrobiales bacterium]
MSDAVILVDAKSPATAELGGHPVIPVRSYLTGPEWSERRELRVVNLCGSTRYRSQGYYASLLAEARGHRVIPSHRTLHDLSRRTLYGTELEALEKPLERLLAGEGSRDKIEMLLLFGQGRRPELRPLARALFETFPVPALRVELRRKGGWHISRLRALGLQDIPEDRRPDFDEALARHLDRRWFHPPSRRTARYDLAILHDPEETLAPSDTRALRHFLRAAEELGIEAELVTRRDFAFLAEYDALFIRETTGVDHHTYRFARRAEAEGLVVIDDPDSILRCTNKIFLAELLRREGVPTPRSVVLGREELDRAEAELGYPMVLKIPDGSFSRGVFKVRDRADLEARTTELFGDTDLLLAQAYTFTPFDWRIGVLAGEPLFACRYHMSRGHWQIMDHSRGGAAGEGEVDTLAVEDAPSGVVETALRAARLIGDGLYGVDLKETGEGVLVIEVNDNPNMDAGVEDAVLGPALYRRVMEVFLARLDERTRSR